MGERNTIRSFVVVLLSPLVTAPCAVEALSGILLPFFMSDKKKV